MNEQAIRQAFKNADGLIITAGAGMGIDSGLPDFRGTEGFWKAYPALGRAKIRFEEIANPQAFLHAPRQAWGFYGHRLELYRETIPHPGFARLKLLSDALPKGAFVFTSNVDGQFQKAGFLEDRILECHGSIHFLQCCEACSDDIWSAEDLYPVVERESGQLLSELPRCRDCGSLSRPNILMFQDTEWNGHRTEAQARKFRTWREEVGHPVVVEIGAGTGIPTVRYFGEAQGSPLIRINPREWQTSREGDFSFPFGALEGIGELVRILT